MRIRTSILEKIVRYFGYIYVYVWKLLLWRTEMKTFNSKLRSMFNLMWPNYQQGDLKFLLLFCVIFPSRQFTYQLHFFFTVCIYIYIYILHLYIVYIYICIYIYKYIYILLYFQCFLSILSLTLIRQIYLESIYINYWLIYEFHYYLLVTTLCQVLF